MNTTIRRSALVFCKRHSSAYSVGLVLSEENMRVTASRFQNMKPVRYQTHEPHRKAAVLIPLCVIDGKVSLLYTLRAPELKSHRGQVSFPGGMLDNSDKSLQHTALRETNEELGIPLKRIKIWGSGQMVVTRRELSVLPVIGQIKNDLDLSSLKVNRSEVEQVFTVPLEELCKPSNLSYTQFKDGYSMPLFLTGPRRIWGLTAVLTNAFLTALLPSSAYTHKIVFVTPVSTMKKIPARL